MKAAYLPVMRASPVQLRSGCVPVDRIPRDFFTDAHEQRALHNHDQTLDQLAARGGLAPFETVLLLLDLKLDWRALSLWGKRTADELMEYVLLRVYMELQQTATPLAVLRAVLQGESDAPRRALVPSELAADAVHAGVAGLVVDLYQYVTALHRQAHEHLGAALPLSGCHCPSAIRAEEILTRLALRGVE